MSFRFKCPFCKANNTADDDDRGTKVKCEKCDKRISVPDEDEEGIQEEKNVKSKGPPGKRNSEDEGDDDDRPVAKKRAASGGGGSMTLILLGGGALALLLCCGACGVGGFLMSRTGSVEEKKDQLAKKKGDKNRKKPAIDPAKVVAKGKVHFDQASTLTANDPIDPTIPEEKIRMKVHSINLAAGKTYVITMTSDTLDTYLRIESQDGAPLAEDDDSAGDLNARVVFRPIQAGAYRMVATTYDGGVGRYRLKVQELD